VGRKKELPLLEKVMITGLGAEGNAIARVDNQVLFIPMLVPGDIADIKVTRKRKNYMEGRVVRFHSYSTDRIKAQCIHFGVCGGCQWQHLPYDMQLAYKENQVRDNLERIGRVKEPEISPIVGSPEIFRYRNKLEFAFSDRRWLTREEISSDNEFAHEDAIGFHIPGYFDKVLDIKECLLQPEPSNLIRNEVREYAHHDRLTFFNPHEQSGFLRNLIIRNSLSGEVMLIFVFFYEDEKRRNGLMDHITTKFPQVTSVFYIINQKKNDSLADQLPVLYYGRDHMTEKINDLSFRVGPKSFYQTNTKQSVQLYRKAKEFAGLKGNETVYDLYTGTGTIACYIADSVGKVVGIEYIEEAVDDARINARLNNIMNASFRAGDIKSVLNEDFISENGRPDVVITDPPRAGMHEDVIKAIIRALPERLVYISCNPSTQARDIQFMSDHYVVQTVQPVDMFPHTSHVENIVLLVRR
jgi:23S rRNA (uracil1939-C5)-methyltransferase